MNKIRDERGILTTDAKEIQRIRRIYFENLYSTKLETLNDLDDFLNTYKS